MPIMPVGFAVRPMMIATHVDELDRSALREGRAGRRRRGESRSWKKRHEGGGHEEFQHVSPFA